MLHMYKENFPILYTVIIMIYSKIVYKSLCTNHEKLKTLLHPPPQYKIILINFQSQKPQARIRKSSSPDSCLFSFFFFNKSTC